MDYRYLKAFSSASRHLSFTKAAQELKISPSAMTRQIALLEASMGAELFIRANKKVLLSELGSRLAQHIAQFEKQSLALKTKSLLRIGCLQSVFEFYLIPVMRKNPKVFAGATDIDLDSPEGLLSKMESGQLDLILSNQSPVGNPTLSAFKVFQEEIDWVGTGSRTIVFTAFEAQYPESMRSSVNRMRINSFNGALALTKQGFGKALFARPSKQIAVGAKTIHQWIYAITPNYAQAPERLKQLLTILRKH